MSTILVIFVLIVAVSVSCVDCQAIPIDLGELLRPLTDNLQTLMSAITDFVNQVVQGILAALGAN